MYYSVGSAYYGTLGAAIAGASSGNTIKVLISNTDTSTVAFSKNLTLNTNGKTITRSATISVGSGVTLSITGTGKITNASSHTITNNGTLNIESATIANTSTTTSYRAISNPGTVTINSGTISAGYIAIEGAGTTNVKGGTVKASGTYDTSNVVAIYGNANAIIKISGGTIIAENKTTATSTTVYGATGITVNRNNVSLEVTGGSISASGRKAFAIENYTADSITTSISISGSPTFTATGTDSTNGYARVLSINGSSGTLNSTINISGGTFTGSCVIPASTHGIYFVTDHANLTITGGSFSSTGKGIHASGSGTITLGTKDGTVSKTSPRIFGQTYGIYGGKINFYDGILIGATPYTSTVAAVETGYGIGKGTETINSTSYNTAFLKTAPTLTASTVSVEVGKTATMTYTYNGDGTITATSSATTIATVGTVDQTNKTIPITGVSEGTTIVIVTAAEGTSYVSTAIEVDVKVTKAPVLNYSVGDEYFETLLEAYKSITGETGTIKVERENTDSSTVTIESGKTITLDTNGMTVTKTVARIENNGNLTIVGNGKITTDLPILLYTTGNFILNDATLESTNSAEIEVGSTVYNKGGNITINSGVVRIDTPATALNNQNAISLSSGGNIVVYDGTIEAISKGDEMLPESTWKFTAAIKSLGTTANSITIYGGTSIGECEDTYKNIAAVGIWVGENTSLIVGTNDGEVSTNLPKIMGRNEALFNGITGNVPLEFYDGILMSRKATFTDTFKANVVVPAGYEIVTGTDGDYKTAYLDITSENIIMTSPDVWTNEAVTVNIEWPELDYTTLTREIKIGNNGTWIPCNEGTCEVYKNDMIYARISNSQKVLKEAEHEVTKIDLYAPTGSVLINNGDIYTNSREVTLNINATDDASGLSEVAMSNEATLGEFENFEEVKTWTLTEGDGEKTVYVILKDLAGNMTATVWN